MHEDNFILVYKLSGLSVYGEQSEMMTNNATVQYLLVWIKSAH